jgi:hypothetical protein
MIVAASLPAVSWTGACCAIDVADGHRVGAGDRRSWRKRAYARAEAITLADLAMAVPA